jgi:Na+/proline symporter
VLGDLPLLGYVVACGMWLFQRALQRVFEQRAAASRDPKAVVGLLAGGSIARAWLAALGVLIVGLFDSRAGLAAAVLILALFTLYFATKLVQRGGSSQ